MSTSIAESIVDGSVKGEGMILKMRFTFTVAPTKFGKT